MQSNHHVTPACKTRYKIFLKKKKIKSTLLFIAVPGGLQPGTDAGSLL